ncbi:MAG: phage baseplate assembly protein, partial [Desulfovibrio piger]|uniref:phage baseplate assembly protein n=2 Tax=Desulfovibrio TaxID=872 RepID=UPI00399A7714
MSERKPDIILEVDGRRYGGWKSIDISRGLEQCAGTFRLSVTDRWPQQNEPRGIKAGAACRVTIDGRAVITGYVDDVEVSWSATSHE